MSERKTLVEQAEDWLAKHDGAWLRAWIHHDGQMVEYPNGEQAPSQLGVLFALELELQPPVSCSTLCSLHAQFPSCELHLPGEMIFFEKKCQLASPRSSFSIAVVNSS